MWGGTEEKQSIAAIQRAIDLGMNLIDTAPAYGYGLSEEIVGKAIKGRRQEVVLATKCGLIWHRQVGQFFFHADEQGITSEASKYQFYRYLHPESIRWEVEQSLRRMQTDYIDLYQTHWPDPTTPIEDTMAALLKLKEEGKIRAIGVSNVSVEQLEQYLRVGPVDSDQEKFSMLDRQMEENGLLEFCRNHNIAVLAYSPLAQGLLTEKMGPDRQFADGDQRRNKPRFSVENRQRIQLLVNQLKPYAKNYGVSLAQLVIAWTISQPGMTHALCGARTPEQVGENAAAADIELEPADLKALNEIVATSTVEIV